MTVLSAPIILAPGPFASLELGPSVLAGVLYGVVFAWALAPGSSFWRCAFLLDNFVGRQIALLRARLLPPPTPGGPKGVVAGVLGAEQGAEGRRSRLPLLGTEVAGGVADGPPSPGVSDIPEPRSADPIENVGVST